MVLGQPNQPDNVVALPIAVSRRAELPVQRTALLGREQAVVALASLLRREDVALATVTGAGGCGKTRLALEVAQRLRADFPDGVVFAGLSAITEADHVATAIAEALDVQEAPDRPLWDSITAAVRHARLLLVLDNFEQVLSAAPAISELLMRCSRLTVLVTSRATLNVRDERVFVVPPLELPPLDRAGERAAGSSARPAGARDLLQYPAVALFCERAAAVRSDFALDEANARAVVTICRHLDGLPLAIELAAARSAVLSPQALLTRLEAQPGGASLQVLTGERRDLPPRQRTLRDTIAWSHDLLSAAERALFRRLAVFAGGWTLEAAEAVCGDRSRQSSNGGSRQSAVGSRKGTESDQPDAATAGTVQSPTADVLEALASLVEKSLVQQRPGPGDEPRFTMLETIHEFALERLAASGEEEAAGDRHAAVFLRWAEQAERGIESAGQAEWLARVEGDYLNLRAALTWFDRRQDAASGLRLAAALGLFWDIHGYYGEGRRWLEAFLALADRLGAPEAARAGGLLWAGQLARQQGLNGETGSFDEAHQDEAIRRLEESLALFRALDDTRGIVRALNGLAFLLHQRGATERATAAIEEGLALCRASGESWWLTATLYRSAQLALAQGDVGRAVTAAGETVRLAREHGYTRYVALGLMILGQVALASRDADRAEPLLEEALALTRSIGDRTSEASTLTTLGYVAWLRGAFERALIRYYRSLMVAQEVAYRQGVIHNLTAIALVLAGQERWERAARLMGVLEARLPLLRRTLPAAYVAVYEEAVAAVRAAIGDAAAWDRGRAMTIDEATVDALESARSAPSQEPARLDTLRRSTVGRIAEPTAEMRRLAELTGREIEVLRLLAAGRSNKQIADALVVSPATVHQHVSNLYQKLDLHTRAQATAFAFRAGLVEPPAGG